MKFKIAVIQFHVEVNSPQKNLEKAKEFIKKASLLGAKLIVFPEDFVSGPVSHKRELLKYSEHEKEYLSFFQILAKKYKIDIVSGSMVDKSKKQFFNAAYYIDFKGRLKSKYRKINICSVEQGSFSRGGKISVFNTRFGKVGLVICWDLVFGEVFRRMDKKKVSLVICPSFWTKESNFIGDKYDEDSDAKFVDSLCVERAFENEIILVYCNAAGKLVLPGSKENLLGHSQVTVPFKGVLKKLNHNKEGMFVVEVNTKILKDAERDYGLRRELKIKKSLG